MKIKRIGVDLAKNVYQLHGVDGHDKCVLKRRLKRDNWLKVLFEKTQPGCEIGMEACTGSHHWARLLREKGLNIRLRNLNHGRTIKDKPCVEQFCGAGQVDNFVLCQVSGLLSGSTWNILIAAT